jgi:hypothetical protein
MSKSMSKYDEMCAAAQLARKDWIEQQSRCWGCLLSLMKGLKDYCAIPTERIRYLRWNGLKGQAGQYEQPDKGGAYNVPAATVFDEEEGFWHLGVLIALTPPRNTPPLAVTFVICIKDEAGKQMIRIGLDEKAHQLDPRDPTQANAFYNRIFKDAMRSCREPYKRKSTTKGFITDTRELPRL